MMDTLSRFLKDRKLELCIEKTKIVVGMGRKRRKQMQG